jgi:hypothetical protein
MRVPSLEASYADHLEGVHQGVLGGVLLGHGLVANSRGSQAARHRQHTGHRAHRAVERASRVDDPTAALHALTSWAVAANLHLVNLEVRRASLEDVYLELTRDAVSEETIS